MINEKAERLKTRLKKNQRGITLLIAILILALLTVFVSTALIGTTASSISTNNDAATAQAFYAAYGGLEKMSKDFSQIFTANSSPSSSQLNAIKNSPPTIPNIAFRQDIFLTRKATALPLQTGPYAGLNTLQEQYDFLSTATTNTGVTVQLTRSLYNNLIPIFQFGIFSTRHMEFYNGPAFNFGGRVHANGDIYLTNSGAITFRDKITTTGQIAYGTLRNGNTRAVGAVNIVDPGAPPSTRNLNLGSVNMGPNIAGSEPGFPAGTSNLAAFSSFLSAQFVKPAVFIKAAPLKLPIENVGNRPIELIRRGLPGEDPATDLLAQSRFFFKAGLRISLSDTQLELPGGTGGIQLNQPNPTLDNYDGYIPTALGAYKASRVNGHRIKGWIKVETIVHNTDGTITTADITSAILALGVTKYEDLTVAGVADTVPVTKDQADINGITIPAGSYTANASVKRTFAQLNDSKAVICLQHYSLPYSANLGRTDGGPAGTLADGNKNRLSYGVTVADTGATAATADTPPVILTSNSPALRDPAIRVPYPITMYDTREGLNLDVTGGSNNLETKGVFSTIDINMQNLRDLLTGQLNTLLTPVGLQGINIPSETNGWIIYVSDRRGDSYVPAGNMATDLVVLNNNKGKYDLETVYGNTKIPANPAINRLAYTPGAGETLYTIEDTNDNNVIETPNISTEGAEEDEDIDLLEAATKGPFHPNLGSDGVTPKPNYLDKIAANQGKRINLANAPVAMFRRAVRLYNGTNLRQAGTPASISLSATRGITIATENPAYIIGNYNATSVVNTGGASSNTAAQYSTTDEVPAAIIADAVTLLSNNWVDARSFANGHNLGGRPANETIYRVAVFAGRTRDGLYVGAVDTERWGVRVNTGACCAGGNTAESDDTRLYGGVHNFLRYIESWGNTLHYCGSIIDGWDSWQANGTFKCCQTVYSPPNRDYTFNTAFLTPSKLPPGTPNLEYILFTDFRENVNPR